jgi:hypothetical protein
MSNVQPVEAEEVKIKEQESVRNALKQSPILDEPSKPVAQIKDKVWFGGYALILIAVSLRLE